MSGVGSELEGPTCLHCTVHISDGRDPLMFHWTIWSSFLDIRDCFYFYFSNVFI